MKQKNSDKKQEGKEGLPVPAGTEQETGLTRGQTEKPSFRKNKERKNGERNRR